MGPGVALKAVMLRRFSLAVFGWSQIVIDLQPLIVMITGQGELHGFSHTLLGATLIGLASGLSGKPLGELGLHLIRETRHLPITWQAAFTSALIGTYSHIAIDSIMHSDVFPLAPLTNTSPFHRMISIEALHLLCLASALIGGVGWWWLDRRQVTAPWPRTGGTES
jgi:hypothetical protein